MMATLLSASIGILADVVQDPSLWTLCGEMQYHSSYDHFINDNADVVGKPVEEKTFLLVVCVLFGA